MTASRRLAVLRAVPIAVLVAVVVVALAARRSPRAQRSAEDVSNHGPPASSRPTSVFDAPLRGPSPPPRADVPPGPTRIVHGGPHHAHRGVAHGPRAPKVLYRVTLDGPVAAQVTASPDESTLYAATLGGRITAFARADGSQRWSVLLGDRAYGAPLVHEDGTIFVGTDAKRFVALSAKGETLWKIECDGDADTSAVFNKDGNVVFAAGRQVYAVRRGGDVAWRFSAKGKVFTAPAVTSDGLVIVGSQDHRVYAIGPGGALAWSIDLGADVDGAPAIADDGAIYVGTDAGEVVKLDPAGHLVWRTQVGGFVRGVLSVARNADVLVGTYGPVPRVVRLGSDGAVRGAFAVPGTGAREFGIHGGPLEDEGGVLYFGAQDDAVYAVQPDGTLRWRFQTKADVDAPLTMLLDGTLVVPSEDGTVTLLLP